MSEDKPKRKVKATAAQPSMSVSTAIKNNEGVERAVTNDNEYKPEELFNSPPAMVGLEYGLTLNIGNYEAARVAVTVSMPCAPADMDATYEKAKAWATSRIQQEVKAVRSFARSPNE